MAQKIEEKQDEGLRQLIKDIVLPSSPPPEEIAVEPKEKLHKQPRGLLKTVGANVARDTENVSLFVRPAYDDTRQPERETISKNTAITAQYLVSLWQKNRDDEGVYKITNLSELARPLNVTPQDLKTYLVLLGGYIYPVITKEKLPNGKTRLSITNDLLFSVKWNFIFNKGEDESLYNKDKRVGTRLSNYIKELPVESVEIIPSKTLVDDLEGNRLGNIFVSDDFVAFCLGLSDMAYKIFCLSGSNTNKKDFKIGFSKLVTKKYLNIEKMLTGQGKPRTLETIKKGLDELKTKEHIEKWAYSEKDDMFTWNYTDKIYRPPTKKLGYIHYTTGERGKKAKGKAKTK